MPASAEDTITIGFTASQTRPLNVDSLGQQRGYEFWRDEVNAAGGIKADGKSYQVKFVSYDDQSVGGRVQQLYTRLVNQDRAQFLFGPYSSGLTAPAAGAGRPPIVFRHERRRKSRTRRLLAARLTFLCRAPRRGV
jgi:ABC-type branched-subunit amino acid transport system substrate-binding protein